MKKLLLFLALTVPLLGAIKKTPELVYVCQSKNAVAYHKSCTYCIGIKNCSHKIVALSKDDAINNLHLRACKICY